MTVTHGSSSIAIKTPAGIKAVWACWNGVHEYDGSILVNCWNTEKTVNTLIGMGDIMHLGSSISETTFCARDNHRPWADSCPRAFTDVEIWHNVYDIFDCGAYYLYDPATQCWHVTVNGQQMHDLEEYKV